MRRAVRVLAFLFWLAVPAAAASADTPSIVHHDLTLRLEIATRTLHATDTLTAPSTQRLAFVLHRSLSPERVLVDGYPTTPVAAAHGDLVEYFLPSDTTKPHRVVIAYSGVLPPLTMHTEREVLRALPPMIGPDGSYLPSGAAWYPDLGTDACTYRVHLDVPADQRGVVPGNLVSEATRNGRYESTFEFLDPAEGIALMVGPYVIREHVIRHESLHPIRLRTYFHASIADLAGDYLSDSARYLETYAAWIGPYPYSSFSIVSSPLPTGIGMPSLTFIGRDVLRLPFIRASSLGHEILHNWWGNGVRVNWDRGNWSEALTTFMADYTFKEQESPAAARDMRWAWLRDFAAVPSAQDRPVQDFTARVHDPSQIIGYNKGAFLFLMLRDDIGTAAFDRGIRTFWSQRQFQRAGWDDLRSAFETSAGRDLTAFFDQWLARTGAAGVRIETARAEKTPTGHRVHLTLAQDRPAYTLRIPVAVDTDAGRETKIVDVSGSRQEVVFELRARPRAVVLDPDFRLFRRLAPSELPPIFRDVMLHEATGTFVLGSDGQMRNAALALARRLLDREPKLVQDSADRGPLLVIGTPSDVDEWLRGAGLGSRPSGLRGGTAQVWAGHRSSGGPVLVISATDATALQDLLRPLPHYGRQSYLVFDGTKVVDRGTWPAESPKWRFE